jgi:tetratricopeptide (TPR) repeat protein
LSVEEKIRIIREAKELPQSAISDILGCGVATVSRFENNKGRYNGEQLQEVRKLLDIEDVPLLDNEIADYKTRLYFLRDYIKDERIVEARRLREELAIITQLPFERGLNLLFEMFSIRLLMKDNCVVLAEEALERARVYLDEMNDEILYHFNYNMGSLNAHKGNFREAQDLYLKAYNMKIENMEKEPNLYYNLAFCHSRLGAYVLAVNTLERAYNKFGRENISNMAMRFDIMLATNYMRIGQIEQARMLFDKVLVRAKNFNHKTYIGGTLHNHGCACLKLGEHDDALEHFERAFEYFSEGENMYLENMYFKIRCLIAMKNATAKVLIPRAMALAEDSEHYQLLFDSLSHLLTIKDEASQEYIHETTIPHLLGKFEYYRVVDYCEHLESAYNKKGLKSKTLEIGAIARDVYRKMIFGGENR